MKFLKSHFWYNKRQQSGVLFLVLLIIISQLIIGFVNTTDSDEAIDLKTAAMQSFEARIDSLQQIAEEKKKFKLYPFNPNFISDYKGYQLGMSVVEIDRLHTFRKQRKYVNSAKEFQKVTKVSDSLLATIAPFFKFPDWVVKRRLREKRASNVEASLVSYTKSTSDLNKATAADFETIEGVGEVIAQRIVAYRKKLQGFTFTSQVYEIWGLQKNTANRILKEFKIGRLPTIQKLNVNTATFKEVLKIPYIDYELCKKIFAYRDEVAELQNITELTNIKDFPMEKYDRIILYLEAE